MSRTHETGPAHADRRRIQQSAMRVAVSVALSSVTIVVAITAVLVTVILTGSRLDEHAGHRGDDWSDRIIHVGVIVPLVVGLGVVGIIALSLVAWYVARRSALPMAEALRVQRAFVADASHELRTPLTTLTSRIQLALHRAERGGDVVSPLEDLRQDARVMDAVLTDLLLAAEAAGNRPEDSHATAAVDTAVTTAVHSLQLPAAGAQVTIAVDVPAGTYATADASALSRAIVALLDNAVHHSPPRGTVTVSARTTGPKVQVRVADEGGGIRGVDPDRLFDRFVRTDDSGRRRGFGLGLALVRDIAARFGGDVNVEHTSPYGTTFLLELPAARR